MPTIDLGPSPLAVWFLIGCVLAVAVALVVVAWMDRR